MKDTIKVDYNTFEKISKELAAYLENIDTGKTTLDQTQSFLDTQSGSAVEALTERRDEIDSYAAAHTFELEVLKKKIDSTVTGMKTLLAPISSDATIQVRMSSVAEFLEEVKTQLALAFALPPITPTSEKYYRIVGPADATYRVEDTAKYAIEEANGDNISKIQNKDKDKYYDECLQHLGKMQSIYDNNITPFFNLDNRIGNEFADPMAVPKMVFEEFKNNPDMLKSFIGAQISLMLLETNKDKATEMEKALAEALAATGENPAITTNGMFEYTFYANGAKCSYKVDLKAKANNPNATGEIELAVAGQLADLKNALGAKGSNFIFAVGTDGVNVQTTYKGMAAAWNSRILPTGNTISVIFTSIIDPETNPLGVTTSLDVSKQIQPPKASSIQNSVSVNDSWYDETWAAIGVSNPPSKTALGVGLLVGTVVIYAAIDAFSRAVAPAMIIPGTQDPSSPSYDPLADLPYDPNKVV
ncbi:MAG: hypothetical protein FWF33_05165 [Clostridiales bacterium]|nr:hypothetical protein [Clostridiales bacterium]